MKKDFFKDFRYEDKITDVVSVKMNTVVVMVDDLEITVQLVPGGVGHYDIWVSFGKGYIRKTYYRRTMTEADREWFMEFREVSLEIRDEKATHFFDDIEKRLYG
jgi:hypothetical protein